MNSLLRNHGVTNDWKDDPESPQAADKPCQSVPKANRQDSSDDQFVLVGVCDGVVVLSEIEVEEYLLGIRVSCNYMFCILVVVLALGVVAGGLLFFFRY